MTIKLAIPLSTNLDLTPMGFFHSQMLRPYFLYHRELLGELKAGAHPFPALIPPATEEHQLGDLHL